MGHDPELGASRAPECHPGTMLMPLLWETPHSWLCYPSPAIREEMDSENNKNCLKAIRLVFLIKKAHLYFLPYNSRDLGDASNSQP